MGTRIVIVLCLISAGCANQKFVLTDDSATSKLMRTKYVFVMQKRNASELICWIENVTPQAREMYLGENHIDHFVRLRACRVTADGQVWVNRDETLLTQDWMPIK